MHGCVVDMQYFKATGVADTRITGAARPEGALALAEVLGIMLGMVARVEEARPYYEAEFHSLPAAAYTWGTSEMATSCAQPFTVHHLRL